MNFFKSFLTSCLGTVTGLLLFVFLIIALAGSLSASEETVDIDKGSVLKLRFGGAISELEVEDPIAGLFPGAEVESTGLIQLTEAIRKAAEDDRISGILLHVPEVPTGMAMVDELQESLSRFKAAGKWVVAYGENYSERAYLLASAADEVYMNPNGSLEFNGLTTEVMFFKKALDKLEIRPQVFRVGDYKSAVEPFLREDISEENRLQLQELLGSFNDQAIGQIAANRKIDTARVREMAAKMTIRNPRHAVEQGLVDSLVYEDGLHAVIRGKLGLEEDDRIPFVRYSRFRKTYKSGEDGRANEIAVIVADGDIMPGKGDNGVVGTETIVEALRRARKSEKVKAVVLRINSPGGSFTASDDMWREIRLTSAEKPVIASMSDVAASGGYYLAMACDTIVARPSTITGSIGVFSIVFDISGFLGNKIGITSSEVKTGEVGDLFTMTRPLTEQEKSIFQTQTDEVYEIFTGKAAEGRGMTIEDLKKVAGGRVWSGIQAKENGLVDVLGGLQEAIRIASVKAGVGEEYHLKYYPRPKTLLEKLMEEGESEVSAGDLVQKMAGPEEKLLLQQWKKIKEYAGVQARMTAPARIR